MRKNLAASLLLLVIGVATAMAQTIADYNIIPLPRSIVKAKKEGTFVLTAENKATALRTKIDASPKLWATDKVPAEAYEIKITPKGIDITAASDAGVLYAMNLLTKAAGPDGVINDGGTEATAYPFAVIHDSPEFSYRGVHLDCSRHFFPLSFVKKYIDIIALHNCNVLHWHITDDQGWRFEVKRYPKLTMIGSRRDDTVIGHNLPIYDDTPHEGFYTQDECREIVRYAAERNITVMPEVDLPGHMVAALASYPELGCTGGPYKVWNMWGVADDVLCAGNPMAQQFVKDVLKEIIDVFPSKMIHLGGDECPKTRWMECEKCRSKMAELGATIPSDATKSEEAEKAGAQLQNWFMHEAEKFLNDNDRTMIGWDEILDGDIAENAAVMSWRGIEGGITAARAGHDVVMTPISYCYLNFYQSKNREAEPGSFDGQVLLSNSYAIPVIPEALNKEEATHILGCQANLWTEYITSPQEAEWMLLPRLAAICEAQWMPLSARSYDSFLARLPRLKAMYAAKGFHCSDKTE